MPFGGPFPEHPFLALLVLVLGSMAFSFLGVLAGVHGTKFDDIARISTFVILPLTYLGGGVVRLRSRAAPRPYGLRRPQPAALPDRRPALAFSAGPGPAGCGRPGPARVLRLTCRWPGRPVPLKAIRN
ncbi:MAG: ABC transporter permease [Planctomycetota bacterium]